MKDGKTEHITREPEQVKAFRDTWRDGIHSYLSYLRDRLTVARDLLPESGSIFVQIGDENVHYVRALLEEVFGTDNFVSEISFQKTSSTSSEMLSSVYDLLLWFRNSENRLCTLFRRKQHVVGDRFGADGDGEQGAEGGVPRSASVRHAQAVSEILKYRPQFQVKQPGGLGATQYSYEEDADGTRLTLDDWETLNISADLLSIFSHDNITSQRPAQGEGVREFSYEGKTFHVNKGTFKTDTGGLTRLARARRMIFIGNTLRYGRFLAGFSIFPHSNLWTDTVTSGFADPKVYVVQTKVRMRVWKGWFAQSKNIHPHRALRLLAMPLPFAWALERRKCLIRDRQEVEALEDRMGRVLGLFQDAHVKGELAQLAVDEARGGIEAGGRRAVMIGRRSEPGSRSGSCRGSRCPRSRGLSACWGP